MTGLKIPWANSPCGSNSHLRHHLGDTAWRSFRLRCTSRTAIAVGVTALVTLAVLLFAEEGHCEERRVDLAKPLAIYGLGRASDYASTRYALARIPGSREGWGPTIAMGGPGKAMLISTGLLIGSDVVLQKTGHRGWARALRIVATGASVIAVGSNVWKTRQKRRL